jgi:hypothetical protein
MAAVKKELTPPQKAKQLVDSYGVVVAKEVIDGLLTEIQELGWNQKKIDYYLDVRSGVSVIETYLNQNKK